jgi:ATP-binding cassette subfamily C (CFTR/MRP) protein 1
MSAVGCVTRIETYLRSTPRIEKRVFTGNAPTDGELKSSTDKDTVISVQNGSFGWSDDATISDINLSFASGEITFLLGPVASGKSTLLKALLGETPYFEGAVIIASPEIAFCDQSPWLLNTSIRSNILGFSSFDSALYKTVVHACDLGQDLAALPRGENTVIGSKGFALSGGQKQRIVKVSIFSLHTCC